jgi:hypothetical protein
MGRVRYASDVAAPVDIAFSYLENHAFVPEWLFGVSRFEPVGTERGLGAVFHTCIPIGPWSYRFHTRIVEYRPDAVLGLTGPGIGTQTFRVDPLGCGRSVLTIEIDYQPPWFVAARLAELFGRAALHRTESRLRRGIERQHGRNPAGRCA